MSVKELGPHTVLFIKKSRLKGTEEGAQYKSGSIWLDAMSL